MNDFVDINEQEEIDYIYRINEKYSHLSKSQRMVAKYLMDHKEEISRLSITQLAKKIGVTPSTITRFCQSLNYSSYAEMKVYMGKSLISNRSVEYPILRNDPTTVLIQKLMIIDQQAIADTMMLLNPHRIDRVSVLCARARNIHFYGEGATGVSADMATAILMQVGIMPHSYTNAGLMKIAAASLEKGDIAFGITYSGKAPNVLDAIRMAKKNGALTVAITARSDSPLANAADYQLIYSSNIEDELTSLPVARICEIAIIGLLQVAITRISKVSADKITKIRNSVKQLRENNDSNK